MSPIPKALILFLLAVLGAFFYYLSLLYSPFLAIGSPVRGRAMHAVVLAIPAAATAVIMYLSTRRAPESVVQRWAQILLAAVLAPGLGLVLLVLWFLVKTGETL
jgi:hypothetical protein